MVSLSEVNAYAGRPWVALDAQVDAATGTRNHHGNAIAPLFNGQQAWAPRLHHLADASLILVKTYEFLDDSAGRDMVRRLCDRARAGAYVVIQYDYKGTMQFPRYLIKRSTPRVLWPLRGEPRVVLVPCHTPHGLKNIATPCDHKKYFITFRPGGPATLVMGGLNIGDRYCFGGRPWRGTDAVHGYRDTDVIAQGPVVQDAVRDFMNDLQTRAPKQVTHVEAMLRSREEPNCYAPNSGTARARVVSNAPRDKTWPERLSGMFEVLLQNVPAGETVLLSNAYLCPIRRTRDAMVAAANRGVKLVFLNNAADVHDSFGKFMGFTGHGFIRRMLKVCPPGSLRVYEWHASPDSTMCSIHQKVACFGESGPVWVGSANLDAVSAKRNFETVMVIEDDKVRARFIERFMADLARPNVEEITSKSWTGASRSKRMCERVVLMVLGGQL